MMIPPPPRAGQYSVIYADPPWTFETYSAKGKGRSAYAGDGLNKALVDVGPFLAAVESVKAIPPVRPDVEPLPPKLDPQAFGLAWAIKFIMQAIGLLTWRKK